MQVPLDTPDDQYPINIFSCAASEQPVAAFKWYQEDYTGGGAGPIIITVASAPPAVGMLEDLCDIVVAMNLHNGIENSLDAKLDAAMNALDDINENNDQAAVNSLEAFINAVEAQRDNKITSGQADILIGDAQAIIDELLSPE